MKKAVIVSAVRTPTGSLGGNLASFSAPELGSAAIKGALEKIKLDPKLVDEVYFGNVIQAGVGQAPARQAALGAGLPPTVCCTTVNKVCASGMKAVSLAASSIALGDAEIVVCGGMESMSNAPFILPDLRFGKKYGDSKVQDALSRDGLKDAYSNEPMGNCAEQCASEEKFTRAQQDEYAAQSFARAAKAQASGYLASEICSIKTKRGVVVDKDEFKPTSMETLAKLRTVFNPPNTVTAGNASTINDGASALVLMSEERALKMGIPIIATVLASADAETDPNHFTIAPSLAVPKALAKCGNPKVDFYEFNEAFSVVALANVARLKLDANKVNVYGGAVSLGHPLGSSGSRIIVTLLNVLQREGGKVGCAAICNGGGGASAIVVELYNNNKSKL